MKRIQLALAGALTFIVPSLAFAWGDLGHQSTAEIAERNLTPQAKNFVLQILGPEPLAVAATWPDQVRSDPRFNAFANYHFAEVYDGYHYATKPKSLQAAQDAYTILSKAPAMLTDPSVSLDRKRILLRYIIHVAGDVHQPLHIGNGLDRGANLCDVNWVNPDTGIIERANLHTILDEKLIDVIKVDYVKANSATIGTAKRYFGYQELVTNILADPNVTNISEQDRFRISHTPLLQWLDESEALRARVYPDPRPRMTPQERPYCKIVNLATQKVENGAYDPNAIPTLNRAYADQIIPIVKTQIFKGGLRLANLLNYFAEVANLPPAIPMEQTIQSVLLKNF